MAARPQSKSDLPPVPAPELVAGTEELIRSMLERLVQSAVDQQFERAIGAQPWERSAGRRGWRNGSKPRQFKTRVGTLELRIPKDRAGQFQPTLFARYQRSEKALVLALVQMYIRGVSTRKVSAIVEQLCGFAVSASQVSRLSKQLDDELAAWRTRELGEIAYPFLMIDAHYEKVRHDGKVRSTALLWVMGIREDGYREHLGVWSAPSESEQSWSTVCQDLLKRGLRGVQFIVSDEHAGLRQALTRSFPGAAHQRCQVHYLRNVLAQCPSVERFHAVKARLREVWDSPNRETANQRVQSLLDELNERAPRLAAWMEETVEETLAVFELTTPAQRQCLRSTNAVEHDHAEMRRRTRVVRIFPDIDSLVRLSTALAIERNDQWSQHRYLLITQDDQVTSTWRKIRHG
jgi:putative transposase